MEIIPHEGINLVSVLRGILGLSFLVFLSFLISSDKKNIPWKTVIIGLSIQLIIGISILKVPVIKNTFEKIANTFITVIESTIEGTSFLFGSLLNNDNNEYIFALNVLPVIIFFSALTSILYYYGVIQKTVGFFAWGLKNIVKILI